MPLSQQSHVAHTETQICDGRGECMEGLAALVFGWQGITEEGEPEEEADGGGGK